MIKRLCIIALTLGTVLIVTPQAAAQQNGGIEVSARAGFDNIVQPDAWLPIHVTASNDGPDFSGQLRIEVPTLSGTVSEYTRPIDLPQGSRKVVTLYAHQAANLSDDLRVDLLDGNRVTLTETVEVQIVPRDVLLVGVWSEQPAAISGLGGIFGTQGELATAFINADDLPDVGMAWEPLDVLIIANTDTGQLTPDQQSALAAWVAQGGRLIVAAGTDFQRTTAGLGDLLPLEATTSTETDLEPLAAAVGQPFRANASQEAPVATGDLTVEAQVLVEAESGEPLLVYQDYGAGRVDLLTFDLSLEPLASWGSLGELWRFILGDGAPRPGWAFGFVPRWDEARMAVGALPGVSLPNVLQLCGFLALYVVLVGPVNYFVLWRLKKRELAWITIPGLVLVFSLIAYLTGFQLRGGRAIVHRLAVVQTYPDTELARVDALVGVWSPRRANYDVQLPPGLLAFPMPREFGGALVAPGRITVEAQPQNTIVRDISVDIGAITPVVVQGMTRDAPRLAGDVTLQLDDEGITLTGDIINESAVDFEQVTLVFGGSISDLRGLPAGEVLRLETGLSGGVATRAPEEVIEVFPTTEGGFVPGGFVGPQANTLVNSLAGAATCNGFELARECALIRSVLNGEGRGSSVYLVAWSDTLPFDTEFLNANAETEDLVVTITELGTVIQGVDGAALDIPPGLMTWQPLSTAAVAERVTPYSIYVGGGSTYAFRFQPLALVPELDYEELAVTLQPDFDPQSSLPTLELYDQEAQTWREIPVEEWGTTVIEDAAAFIGAGGVVDARITAGPNAYYSINRFDVTLTAQ